jgi:hypothetical protein
MNTNTIKSFAKQARLLLLDGVSQRLKYWGFNQDGKNSEYLESTTGGYIFRGKVFTNVTIPPKWNNLKKRLTSKQAVNDVVEQAAYTWFNRLMAIKILEENRYITEQLAYAPGLRTPMIVQNAKHGRHELVRKSDKELLLEYLQEDKEELAFGLLITNLCNRNNLLHDVFRRIDDFTEILLPQNLLQKDGLLDLINSNAIADQDYKEVELIGWLYQFYISDKKDEVFAGFKKNKKARAEDIPAATQIFTPKWIVKYMVENTVGKIYLDYEPASDLKDEMKYLVENVNDSNQKPVISDITELTLIDPACGSGHILVTGFDLLLKMYREQGYTARPAVESILKHNLYGLDIDDRAMQLARFAVLLKAAQYDAEVLNKGIIPHVYSFPEASYFTTEELQNFLGYEGHLFTAELKEALQLLNQGKNIGSALKLELSEEAGAHIEKQLQNWEKLRETIALDLQQTNIWSRLKPFLEVLLVHTKHYTAVVANPPYLAEKNMNIDLRSFIKKKYNYSKSDLSMVFLEVISNFSKEKGSLAIINQWSWLCTDDFVQLRKWFLESFHIYSELFLGIGVFPELNSKKVQSVALAFKNEISNQNSIFIKLDENFNSKWKQNNFVNPELKYIKNQKDFERIEGAPFTFWFKESSYKLFDEKKYLGKILDPRQGMATTDNKRFLRIWYEVPFSKIGFNLSHVDYLMSDKKYFPYNKGGGYRKWFGNNEFVIEYTNDGADLLELVRKKYPKISDPEFVIKNRNYYFKKSITWGLIALRYTARYSPQGFIFDVGGSSGFPPEEDFEYVLGLLNSKVASYYLQGFNYTLNIQVGDLKRIAFKKNQNQPSDNVLKLTNENIEISKKDWDFRETSWDFKKNPLLNESISLKQAYKHWQEQVNQDFFQLHVNEEELNCIFIEIYGLQEELTPEVALKDITILQEELDRNALEQLEPVFREKGKEAVELPIDKAEVLSQFLSYCIGIILGRYRIDKTGLNIAHPNPSEEELASYSYNGHKIVIDEDAIMPIMGENCAFPDDALVRIKKLILAIWGENTLTENMNFLQNECLGMNLHNWLNERFWNYHTGMYKKKPIYWLFSSNPGKPQKAAFKVLVYMHRMDKYTVQRIQRNYLHPHQEYIQGEIDRLRENEDNLSRNEQKRLDIFENWKTECIDYNEVLKELANKQIEFDLDDGVSVNYAKFEGAVAKI